MKSLVDMFKKADDEWEEKQEAKRDKYVQNTKMVTNSTIVALNTLKKASETVSPVPVNKSGGSDG